MNEVERQRRARKLLSTEATRPEAWWWLSFAGAEGNRGVAIVRAHGLVSAIVRSHNLEINPGGEVAGYELDEALVEEKVPEDCREVLLTSEQLAALKLI